MSIKPRRTNGTTLMIDIGGVDVEVGLLDSITPPSAKVRNERVDPLNSLTTIAVATGGLENETSEFAVYLDLLDSTHSYCLAVTNDETHANVGEEHTFTVTLPLPGINPWIYEGLLEKFTVKIEKGTLQKATGMIQVNRSTQLPTPTA